MLLIILETHFVKNYYELYKKTYLFKVQNKKKVSNLGLHSIPALIGFPLTQAPLMVLTQAPLMVLFLLKPPQALTTSILQAFVNSS